MSDVCLHGFNEEELRLLERIVGDECPALVDTEDRTQARLLHTGVVHAWRRADGCVRCSPTMAGLCFMENVAYEGELYLAWLLGAARPY